MIVLIATVTAMLVMIAGGLASAVSERRYYKVMQVRMDAKAARRAARYAEDDLRHSLEG